ncbi:hypothetical protein GLYMA_07G209151v4 [Glycine max]|nr:hypothetical protein GLYMA_07G209151v4 [Glycine max]KAH1087840.1 hypothetical protein GYH30_019087 [Glycine max]
MFLLVVFNLSKTALSDVSGCMYFSNNMYRYHDGLSLFMYLHLNMNGNIQNSMDVQHERK